MATGRPTDFNEAIAQKICDLILDGNSIRHICSFVDMPHVSTVMRWLDKHEDFAKSYAQAKAMFAEFIFDEIIEIADTCPPEQTAIAKAKLMIDARRFTASKLAPKKYGAKVEDTQVNISEPQSIQVNIVRATKQISDIMDEIDDSDL